MITNEKGYLVEIHSWENDGDNPETNSLLVDSEEKAKALIHLAKQATSCSDKKSNSLNIGNTDENYSDNYGIAEFMIQYPILIINNRLKKSIENLKFSEYNYIEELETFIIDNEIDLSDEFMYYNSTLLGHSEYYFSRVYDGYKVSYVESTIESKKVNI